MRTIFCFFFLALLFSASNSQVVKLHGQLKVKGTTLIDAKGNDVVLHGMSFGWHNWWPRFYNAGSVHELATKWNCTVIRAAMGVEPDSGYLKSREQSITLMKNVIDACIKENVYVIIDWHDHNIHQKDCLLYTSDAADERSSVDLGGRRIIKKKK